MFIVEISASIFVTAFCSWDKIQGIEIFQNQISRKKIQRSKWIYTFRIWIWICKNFENEKRELINFDESKIVDFSIYFYRKETKRNKRLNLFRILIRTDIVELDTKWLMISSVLSLPWVTESFCHANLWERTNNAM